jgi:SAM-dependent methyltransferase
VDISSVESGIRSLSKKVGKYSAVDSWTPEIAKSLRKGPLPAQGLVRIIKGNYPELSSLPLTGSALDVGCGDARNATFLDEVGFNVTGIEISNETIVELREAFPQITFNVGFNSNTKQNSNAFDLIVSWHAAYYLGSDDVEMSDVFSEFYRCARKTQSSRLIISVPMGTSFIYSGCGLLSKNSQYECVEIRNDPFNIRNGEILAKFNTVEGLVSCLADANWTDFQIGEEKGNWFGLQYDWWTVVCRPSL